MNQQRFVFDDSNPAVAGSHVCNPPADGSHVCNPPEAGSHAHERAHEHVPFAFVRHPRARRYVVRVKADGTVSVTIPRHGSKREAAAFAESQRDWIERQRSRLQRERASRPPEPSADVVRAGRSRAVRELPPRLRQLAAQFGLAVSRVSIRNQRARWGSCSRSGHICLNWRLVSMPDWVRDYVLIHELMHLKRMDHSPKFWKLVAAACPDWREARTWLRDYERTATTMSI
jgi:predicted metal-dependent hydrolase